MKVGTDGILLGAWATAETPSRILDIGTGTGLVALMLAQRFPAAMIDAVEANSDACGQAAGNFQVSPWADRLTAVYCRIQEFESAATYSLIVSNPPWFHDSMKPDDQARDTARHTDSMSPADLISAVARLMANDGVFTTILPVVEGQSFLGLAAQSGFHCHRCCEVLPLANVPAKRLLLEFTRQSPKPFISNERLIVETNQRHYYTPEFMQLTIEFYLRF